MPGADLREDLYQTGIQGVLFILNLPDNRLTRGAVERFFGAFLKNVIEAAACFDEMIASRSLGEACAWIAARCGTPAEAYGSEQVPASGPVLLASNHPGYFETMVIAAQLPRDDLRVIVGGVPYFNRLPNTRRHIFYTDHSQASSVQVLRDAVAYLREGGMVLIYPSGLADPDPDWLPGASERLERWSPSVALMLRRAPETRLVPVIASGILSPGYLRHPFARIQGRQRFRQRAAELFQMYHQFRDADCPPLSRPRLSFGAPVSGAELAAGRSKEEIMPEVIGRARSLLEGHMARAGGQL